MTLKIMSKEKGEKRKIRRLVIIGYLPNDDAKIIARPD